MKRLLLSACMLLLLSAAAAIERSQTIVHINGAKYYVHTVKAGETLYSLAKTYGVSESVILGHNPSVADGLKAETSLRIPVVTDSKSEKRSEKQLRKTFDTHQVARGETLYGIARRYAIDIRTVIADNPDIDPARLQPGQRILIRKTEAGHETEAGNMAQWEEYRDRLNSVADKGYAYHIVHKGETFYALSHRFAISEEELSRLNDGLQPADLKAGALIRVPSADTATPAAEVSAEEEGGELQTEEPSGMTSSGERVVFRALRPSEPLHVALLLPLTTEKGEPNANYLDFYRGFLMGLDSVRTGQGRTIRVDLFDTARDESRVEEIVSAPEFRRAELIVGPVYETALPPVLRYAEKHAIPVVSPLAHITRLGSETLFQLAPAAETKHDKLRELLTDDRQVTLIYTDSTDKEFEREVLTLLGNREYGRFRYQYIHPREKQTADSDLTPLLQNGRDNLFVIMADNEIDVDRTLAALASADVNHTARGNTPARFAVLGNTRWNRYANIDRTIFFKDRVVMLSAYHAKRDADIITTFDSNYVRAFGSLPTLYSYRGYDAAMIFAPAMYGDIEYDMEGRTYTPLQTGYRFVRQPGGNHVNTDWTRVEYRNDFTIHIE